MKAIRRPLLALALALAAFAAPAVRAQVVTPQPPPTIITTAPYTINAPGYYQLGANLTYAGNPNINNDAIITINSGNVTLDFAGHYISGPSTNKGTFLYGVFSNERGNINVRNGTVAYCYEGILLAGNNNAGTLNINQRVDNMLVTFCYSYGIVLSGANYSQVTNNRITSIGGGTGIQEAAGIYLSSGASNELTNNTIASVLSSGTSTAYGIYNSGSMSAFNNKISTVSSPAVNGGVTPAYGIYNNIPNSTVDQNAAALADGNTIRSTVFGVVNGCYRNNVLLSVFFPTGGGTDLNGNVGVQ